MKTHRLTTRLKRKNRMRRKLMRGTQSRPRLSVFRSNYTMYAQLIDDVKQITLVGVSDKQVSLTDKNKINRAKALGVFIAEKAKKMNVVAIVFDRSGYTYHGRVKALAEGLREGGLKF